MLDKRKMELLTFAPFSQLECFNLTVCTAHSRVVYHIRQRKNTCTKLLLIILLTVLLLLHANKTEEKALLGRVRCRQGSIDQLKTVELITGFCYKCCYVVYHRENDWNKQTHNKDPALNNNIIIPADTTVFTFSSDYSPICSCRCSYHYLISLLV